MGLRRGCTAVRPLLPRRPTLRGFKFAGVGPRDTSTDDALGGNLLYTGSAELRFPLGLPEELRIFGRTFVDAGTLY